MPFPGIRLASEKDEILEAVAEDVLRTISADFCPACLMLAQPAKGRQAAMRRVGVARFMGIMGVGAGDSSTFHCGVHTSFVKYKSLKILFKDPLFIGIEGILPDAVAAFAGGIGISTRGDLGAAAVHLVFPILKLQQISGCGF